MSRSPRALVTLGAAILAVMVGVGLVVWRVANGASHRAHGAVRVDGLTPARPPFESSTAGVIRVGGRSLSVVIADDDAERITGLRGRHDASPYDGMLFVFRGDTRTAFTMAGVPGPLDIGFYAADGSRVDRRRMLPCAGTDATCPVYESRAAFRYALETAPGALPDGSLRVG